MTPPQMTLATANGAEATLSLPPDYRFDLESRCHVCR